MADLAIFLSQKETEYQQLLRMHAELTQNLQQVNASLLRTEGAIVALRAVVASVPDDEPAFANDTSS